MFDCLTVSCSAELSLTISSVPRPSSGVCAARLTSRLSAKQRASRPARCLSELSVFINLLYILIIITGRCGRLALALLMSQHRLFIHTDHIDSGLIFCPTGFSCWAERGGGLPGVRYQCSSDGWSQSTRWPVLPSVHSLLLYMEPGHMDIFGYR